MSESAYAILLAGTFAESAIARARRWGHVRHLPDPVETDLLGAVADCHALVVRSSIEVSESLIRAAPELRVIGRAGVGYENVDVAFASARGITVCYTPAASTDAVADLTVGLLLATERRIASSDQAVRAGQFATARHEALGRELGEMSIGIIGFGRIGQAVARRCHMGFGMKVLYNDIINPVPQSFPVEAASKETIYKTCDVISLHVPLTADTRYLICDDSLGLMRPECIVLNTSRGAVVHTADLTKAVLAGHIRGAGLDVVDPEPLPAGHSLLSAERAVLTPHIGARTPAAQRRMAAVIDDVGRVLGGLEPQYPV